MKINTGQGQISLVVLLAIWSVSAVVSLPGLAVSPILGDLHKIFPGVSDLETQMLTSLPSLLIIPFVLLSGKLSVGRSTIPILMTGLAIFFLCGIGCFFARSMRALIWISCLLGVGAGMVIPISTGLVADYFTGSYRVRQLGYSSAINNLTLVLATMLTGYLAEKDWHLPFLVYTLPGVVLILSFYIRRYPPKVMSVRPPKGQKESLSQIDWKRLTALMGFYFFITFVVLAIVFYLPFLTQEYRLDSSFSGLLISLFFLAITLPGVLLNRIIRLWRANVNLVSLFCLGVGLLLIALFRNDGLLILGCIVTGLGYGVMQPIIYEKTTVTAPPQLATFVLSCVMSVNYLAIMICPFMIDLLRKLFHTTSDLFPFWFNAAAALVVAVYAWRRRGSFVLGMDTSYYE